MRRTRTLTTSAGLLLGGALLALVTGCSIPSITIGGSAQPTPAGSGAGSGSDAGSGGGAEATAEEGSGDGSGDGSGEGSGDGSGDGSGNGSGDGGAPQDVPRDYACGLLEKAEAEAAIGMGLDDGVPSGGGDGALCMWTAPPTGPIGQVEVVTGPGAQKVYEIDVDLGHEFVDVDGLGDEAYYEYNMIFFRKGETWIGIRITSLADTDFKQPLIDAAQRVHDRI